MESLDEHKHLIQNNTKNNKSLGMISTVAYIVSVFGIPPILTLPGALSYCGVLGFVIIPILIVIQAYTAVLLGKSWVLMENNYQKEISSLTKYPYSALALKVGGTSLHWIVGFIQNLAIFGESVPFLILGSENVQALLNTFLTPSRGFSFCFILIITALVMTPTLWLGTAKDLRYITWLSGCSIVILWFSIMYMTVRNAPPVPSPHVIWPSSWLPFAYTFGTVAFQFGVHPIIMAVQMDMKDTKKLSKACVLSFSAVLVFYGILAILVFCLYGNLVQANLLDNFQNSYLLSAVQIIVAIQSIICLVLSINALYQDLEDSLGIPDTFGWKRIMLRTIVMLCVLFVAETIPHFAISIDLVGGLLMTPIIFIFPPIFYNILKYKTTGEINRSEIFIGLVIIAIGVFGGFASTVESGIQISRLKEFAPPCYIDSSQLSRIINITNV